MQGKSSSKAQWRASQSVEHGRAKPDWRRCVRLSLILLFVFGETGLTAEEREVPLNFETQLIHIFEAARTAPSMIRHKPEVSFQDRAVLTRILDKLRAHMLMLKNAVYRTDADVIRITWADDDNEDVVKVEYKTGKDPILGNSLYADKRQVVNVKIMYRTNAGAYEYMIVTNMDNVFASIGYDDHGIVAPPIPEKPAYNYAIEAKPSNEKCGLCHILAQNDNSPNGVFFPRYQESYGAYSMKEFNSPFHADSFTPKSAGEARALGLPDMGEDFLYQKLDLLPQDGVPSESTRLMRVMIELPQLIEVVARDNKMSICVSFSMFTRGNPDVDPPNNYVCADNSVQKLFVKLTNPILANNKRSKEYTEPYFEKK